MDPQILNINGCKKFNLQWRDRQCYQFSSVQNYNEFLDKEIKLCETKFISKSTCLNITAQPCQYDNTTQNCKKILQFDQPCSFYSNVNKRTCQLLTKFECDFNEIAKACIIAQTTVTDLSGLSKQACLSLSIAAYWNDFCNPVTIFECNQKYQSTSAACTLTETSCIYDQSKQICISQFNINAVFCDTPGVSSQTCTQIIREPCIFKSNKCQRIKTSYSCDQANLVNEMACASLNQACSYDQLEKHCQLVSNSQKCSTLGLSKKACLYNPSCQFNNDFMKCECSIVASPQICSNLSSNNCTQNSKCFFDTKLQICRRKYCEDLSKSECSGQLNNKTCFYTSSSCQSAGKFLNAKMQFLMEYLVQEQIIDVSHITIIQNSVKILIAKVIIVVTMKSRFAKLKNVLNQIIANNQVWRQKIVLYFIVYIQCQTLSNGTCVENQSCQVLDSGICDGQTVRTLAKCSLQKYNIYLDDVLCTSQVCDLYGISELCNGNQYGSYTCALVDQKCLPCEQIKDACQCDEKIEICIWEQNTCRSFQCNALKTKETCNTINRCLWSTNNESCLIHCSKIINADECNSRTDECYYDQAINLCLTGVYQSPNLSIAIDISTMHQVVLMMIPAFAVLF